MKMKRQTTDWDKIFKVFINHISKKWLVPKIYKELSSNGKMNSSILKMNKRFEQKIR